MSPSNEAWKKRSGARKSARRARLETHIALVMVFDRGHRGPVLMRVVAVPSVYICVRKVYFDVDTAPLPVSLVTLRLISDYVLVANRPAEFHRGIVDLSQVHDGEMKTSGPFR